ncbi:hypothetical protein AUJ69_01870 [Candidatus Woesearchaeota archaeon CG1_02_47_18]|nr:MAG: hypothetical protein AUJ69_01870 [Candidatus Woesearchaeota archaeon CG1_02_47_18]
MKHSKLVRDRIPEVIREAGKTPITHIADDAEYWQKLKQKLQEEVEEFIDNEETEELADILEIMYAICGFKRVSRDELESLRKKKAGERGGFKSRIILEEVKMKESSGAEKEDDEFWADGAFAETLGPEDLKEKMKTFHKKHDEDMNFNCRKCNKPISAHNKDWHNGMCDDCFNKEFFPDNEED